MSKPKPLAGQTAVITGAGSGMGRSLAERLSGRGCPVAICDANEATLRETEAGLSGPVLARVLDVRDRQGQLAFAAEVAEWAPAPIGAVFNNAGVALSQTVAEAAPEDDEWLMAINFDGVMHGTRAYLPILLEQGSGTIVNTSSVFGLAGIPTQSAYCASKFAVRGFTESLRHELRGSGVRAATVHPGGIKTNIVRSGRMKADPRGLGRSSGELIAEFDALTRTTAERAAAIIHKGVDAGKARILVGADAHLIDVLTRLTPTHYYGAIERITDLASRRAS
ncbi:MAG: short-chain alcohol dehydrogenase [Solirubrobacterales bacterium]|nr:short-chain alcohol dehydrogenase [Solirubrobacterales bacterium]